MSQTGLAEAAGLNRSTVANIEGGRQRVTLDVLVAVARALRVDPAQLLPTLQEVDRASLTADHLRARVASEGGATTKTERALLSLLKPKKGE